MYLCLLVGVGVRVHVRDRLGVILPEVECTHQGPSHDVSPSLLAAVNACLDAG